MTHVFDPASVALSVARASDRMALATALSRNAVSTF
jgi:hypothetical protein